MGKLALFRKIRVPWALVIVRLLCIRVRRFPLLVSSLVVRRRVPTRCRFRFNRNWSGCGRIRFSLWFCRIRFSTTGVVGLMMFRVTVSRSRIPNWRRNVLIFVRRRIIKLLYVRLICKVKLPLLGILRFGLNVRVGWCVPIRLRLNIFLSILLNTVSCRFRVRLVVFRVTLSSRVLLRIFLTFR